MRSLALRERGLEATSSAEAESGCLVIRRHGVRGFP